VHKPEGLYRVKVRVREVNGYCRAGHRPGDEVIFDDNEVRGKICFDAMCSFISKVYARRYGADLPWLEDKDAPAFHACPDVGNPVVFEIRRLPGNLLDGDKTDATSGDAATNDGRRPS
jgi:uncharacterized repeat protein (TIGR04076 family)